MFDTGFATLLAFVTGLLAAAIYLSGQAATRGGLQLIIPAAASGVLGLLGFAVLARLVVLGERRRGTP